MDVPRFVIILRDLGLPAAISAVLTVLVKTLADARQRSSKESLLAWLEQASTKEPFSGDDRALRALRELQQSLIFERAFGLKAESQLRNELLLFAESRRESTQFRDVLYAGRFVSRIPLARLRSPKNPARLRRGSRIIKPLSYFYISVGYLLLIGGMYLSNELTHSRISPRLAVLAMGFVLGGFFILLGIQMLKQARRYEIAADFLSWLAEYRNSSLHDRSENAPAKTNGAA